MRGSPWLHPSGVSMDSWVTAADVTNTILPEMNSIWAQAKIQWTLESVLEEDIVVGSDYAAAVDYIVNTSRDENGQADPERLPYLYGLMQPANRSTDEQLGTNLFHVYLFPFVGNTSQGNAMASFGYHMVVGIWSNKRTDGEAPEKSYLVEDQSAFVRGSIAATISHELGHVLNLNHNECNNCLMQSNGYPITEAQIEVSRGKALARSSPATL